MNKREAYTLGVDSGYEAGQHGEFSDLELWDEDEFMRACGETCENKRQFADSPTYQFSGEKNGDSLFDAFDEGETVGIRKAWRELYRKDAGRRQLIADALSDSFDGLKVEDTSEIPADYRGEVLHINDHGNVTLYLKTARKLKELASCV